MTTKPLVIGMIGLDTSHCTAFTKLINDRTADYHVPGGKVTYAFKGGSPDFPMSVNRIDKFTAALTDEYGVELLDDPEEVAERSDAIFLTSVDGRVHLEQFRRIAPYGKPVFIDKPFALTTSEARAMFSIAKENGVALMSSSSLRYGQALVDALAGGGREGIIGADCCGFMELQPTQPGLFWYGIHAAEMLYSIMGRGCAEVRAATNEQYEFVTGVWSDGRIGTIRGARVGARTNSAVIHRMEESQFVDLGKHPKPKYAGLVEAAMRLFQTGEPSIEPEETTEIIRFLEAANESRATGKTVRL